MVGNDEEEPIEIPKSKTSKGGGDPSTTKGTVEFYALINEMAMARVGNKVPASGSVVLTKSQIT